jgi:hypothetical protein
MMSKPIIFRSYFHSTVLADKLSRYHLAVKAPQELGSWNLSPLDLKSVGHGITQKFSERLLRVGLLPEGEFHDGLILAETALTDIPALVISDADLLGMDKTKLAAEFEAADLPTVAVCHPKLLLKGLAPERLFFGVV